MVSFTQIERQTLGDYTFPYWTLVLGQMMTASLMLGIVLWPIYAIVDAKFFKRRPIRSLFQPDFEAFVPMREKNKLEVDIARGFVQVDNKQNNENFVSLLFPNIFFVALIDFIDFFFLILVVSIRRTFLRHQIKTAENPLLSCFLFKE